MLCLLSKLHSVTFFVVVTAIVGCTHLTAVSWHQRIAPLPTTQPRSDFDPETGQPLWRDFAAQDFPQPLSRDNAFAVLLNTQTFADVSVGYAGTTSIQVQAFRILLAQDDAQRIFADLMARANVAGKLYALCAFYLIAPEEYARAERQILQSSDVVRHEMGCIIDERPVREVIHSSATNAIRLSPRETVAQWFARVKPSGQGGIEDISGGAIPESFRDAR